jgi:hypothetical protein
MAIKTLSKDELALGRAILLATDALDMDAEGAFWLHDKKDDEWRFFLVTSLFSRIDPREVYLCLNQALTKILSAKEVENFRLYIATPNEDFVQHLRKQIRTATHVSTPLSKKVTIDGDRLEACFYRLAKGLNIDQAKRVQRRFRKSCREIAAT